MWSDRWLLLVITSLFVVGCAPIPPPHTGELVSAERESDAPEAAAPEAPPASARLLMSEDPEVQAALKTWRETDTAPIIQKDDFLQYPYGLTEVVVTCQPQRVCDIELEPGEEILNVSLGDTARWLTSPAFSGERDRLIPHVIVKPVEPGIATNAVITTTRRTYYLALVAPKEKTATHVRRIKFYYPHDLVQQATGRWRADQERRQKEGEQTVARLPRVALAALNFAYAIEGDDVPWRPLRVFDDGTRVYIQMPAAMRATEAPALLVETRAGETALVNYRLRQSYLIVDKLFERAVLLAGVGGTQERVTIRRVGSR